MRHATLMLWLCGSVWAARDGAAQPAAPAEAPPLPARTAQGHSLPPAPPPAPPRLPPARNPVATLRELLAQTPAQRQIALAGKTEAQRRYLNQRLREFDALDPAQRELRLRLLQLRYFLLPLMRSDASNRVEQLRAVPEEDRQLIADRLRQWDRLPPQQQQQLLQNEQTLRYFPNFETNTPAQQAALLGGFSAQWRRQLEGDLNRWRAYSPEERQRMSAHFQQFFSLSARQKARTLDTLSPAERRQMSDAMKGFENLPAERRAKCIEAFQRFSAMTEAERVTFLANAARWEAMSPEERQAWRQFTARLPPSPPGLGLGSPMPPLPPAPPSRPPPVVATDTNASRL